MTTALNNPNTRARRLARWCALGAAALLAGCGGGVNDVHVLVTHSADGAPARGAHVRAVALASGLVPLPLDERTVPELLAMSEMRSGAFVGVDGRASLRLTPGRVHLVEVDPSPFEDVDDAHAGEWWLLDEATRTLSRVDRVKYGADASPARFDVKVSP